MTKFGVAGNSESFFSAGHKETVEAAAWCAAQGIDFFEYSFGRGILLREETARSIGEAFRAVQMEISVHAPYFINFANLSSEMVEKSIGYVLTSIKKVKQLKGNRVVFHPASQGKMPREEVVDVTKNNLIRLKDRVIEEGLSDDILLCPETMGKQGQIGTVDEVIMFCGLADFYYPCFDFGHINAREQGILKTKADYNVIFQKMLDRLPLEKVKNMHIHFSKIEYGKMGEIRHLTFEDTKFGPEFEPLAESLWENGLEPHITCESAGTQAEDAVYMKKTYFSLKS